jgi:hypothetical protein
LVKATGWTEDEIAAADGPLCDWFLMFDELERQLGEHERAQVVTALRRGGD